MRVLPAALLTAALLPLGTLACGGGGGGGTTSGGGGVPGTTCPTGTVVANPTFQAHIYPALVSSCGSGTSSCHGVSNPPAGHLRYDTGAAEVWANLVNAVPSNAPAGYFRVKPGDVSKSWIIEKVTSDNPGGGFGQRMPLAAPNLCTPTVDTWKNWINAGAPF